MAHRAIGRLRGRGEPREDILDRLLEINPNFVVCWLPPGVPQVGHGGEEYQRPPMWVVCERRQNFLLQSAAKARLDRMMRWPEDKLAPKLGIVYGSEHQLDGLHTVGEFSEDYFGTDRMFQDLIQGENELREFQADMRKAQDQQAEDAASEEMNENPEYAEFVREVAKDFYNRVKGNAVVGYNPSKR